MFKTPVEIQLEITKDCNNQCSHCYNFWRYQGVTPKKSNYENPLNSNLINICKKLVEAEIFHVVITGGEPLLHYNQLIKIAKHLISNNVDVSINSNLTLLTLPRAHNLASLGIKNILTSLTSYKEDYHNQTVNNKNAFQQTITGVRNCVNAGLKTTVHMVVTKNNYLDVYKTGKFVKKLGASTFCATRIIPAIKEHLSISLNKKETEKMIKQLHALKKEGLKVDTLNPLPYCALDDKLIKNTISQRSCTAGLTIACMDADGNVRVCTHNSSIRGNVLKRDLKEIWQSIKPWREIYLPHKCRDCAVKNICGGGCRYIAKVTNGHLNDPDPLCAEKITKNMQKIKIDALAKKKILLSHYKFNHQIKYRAESLGGILYLQPSNFIKVGPSFYRFALISAKKIFSYRDARNVTSIKSDQLIEILYKCVQKKFILATR